MLISARFPLRKQTQNNSTIITDNGQWH
uniref:Uncharacterized protein n=1 Tax=Anguilla anguilla TaxID=7936 RepID=A0A0E9Q626_ANGAN